MHSAKIAQAESEFATRLANFIAAWTSGTAHQSKQEASGRWLEFFNGWRDIARAAPNGGGPEAFLFAADRFADFAIQFPPIFGQFRQRGEQFNVWKAAQLGRDEIRNCRVLAGFLDHSAEHGQGSGILCPLLATIGLPDIAKRAALQRYLTRTEAWPLGDSNSHIDIEIEADDFLLFIEVKIGAPETGDQLRRYVELARCKAAHRNWSVIYLTPDRRVPTHPTLCNVTELKIASWKDVAEAVRTCARDAKASPIYDHLLRYAEFVQNFT